METIGHLTMEIIYKEQKLKYQLIFIEHDSQQYDSVGYNVRDSGLLP
jgi:hypothetical protein